MHLSGIFTTSKVESLHSKLFVLNKHLLFFHVTMSFSTFKTTWKLFSISWFYRNFSHCSTCNL